MNLELEKIRSYLKELNFEEIPFSILSKPNNDKADPLVSDNNTAYSFDDISKSFYNIQLHSADALLLKNKGLYLIEFKHIKSMINDDNEKKILRLKLFLKMVESFHTLQEWIFVNNEIDPNKFKKHFILVTEHSKEPLFTTSDACNRLSQKPIENNQNPIGNIYKKSFDKYQQQYKNDSKKVYYDSVEIWADIAFSEKVAKLK